jgi:general stress protein YciG
MSSGTQPHTAHENDSQANGNPSQSNPPESKPHDQHLTPDRPPQPPQTSQPPQPSHYAASEGTGERKPKRPRGFAAMDRKLVSEIARKGGKAAHSAGTAHEFTSEEARVAGRKGGRATHAKRRKADGTEETTPGLPSEQGGEGDEGKA